ncbi:MAG: winged helix-turn-helix domain-containing protein [Puia sp.]|nr:winged helix-turn-helix domain-containing protein [Puia sp.]
MKKLSPGRPAISAGRLIIADLIIDLDNGQVLRDNTLLMLKKKEFQLLKYLASRKNRIVLKSDLIRSIWSKRIHTNTLQAYMLSLHKKVDGPFRHRLIYTASRKGYILFENNPCFEQNP